MTSLAEQWNPHVILIEDRANAPSDKAGQA
jgi:hypothetical protein